MARSRRCRSVANADRAESRLRQAFYETHFNRISNSDHYDRCSVPVACCRARTAGGAAATMTSILSETSSDASEMYRSGRASAQPLNYDVVALPPAMFAQTIQERWPQCRVEAAA